MTDHTEHFSWIPLYGELAEKLEAYETQQSFLLEVMEELYTLGLTNIRFQDQSASNVPCALQEIDPFTFMGIFNRKIKDESRKAICKHLKIRFGLESQVPNDFDSVPILDNRKFWFFPYQYERKPDDISSLWYLFKIALRPSPLENPAFDEAFNRALEIKNVLKNVTMGLYWIRPDVFLSTDNVNQTHLNSPIRKLNAATYRAFVQRGLQEGLSFPELSYQADVAIRRTAKVKPPKQDISISGTQNSNQSVVIQDLAVLAEQLGFSLSTLEQWLSQLQRKKQIILQGPPGTGKTYAARLLSQWLTQEGGQFQLVQFHPSYSYEDFIQGYRPRSINGQLVFNLEDGVFKRFCDQARMSTEPHVFIIDEINRANLSSVFGELMYLLEYRDQTIQLQSGELFSIPENVFIIGSMNTADRSIALMDHALRRRFAFLNLLPNYDLLLTQTHNEGLHLPALIDTLQEINLTIGDTHYWLGHSYFLSGNLSESLPAIWQGEIYPYLIEHFFDQKEQIEQFSWPQVERRFYMNQAEIVDELVLEDALA
jgi:hypothetical protein